MRNTTPKDELPEDVFLQPGDGDRAKMRVVGGQFQVLGENGDWHDGSAGKLPPWNRESIAAAAARYPDPLGWRRALAYYDEQVGRQANNQCTTQSAVCPKCGSAWTPAELPCLSAKTRVGMIECDGIMARPPESHVLLWLPEFPIDADGAINDACRALWTRCVVDDEGRVWEMVPAGKATLLIHDGRFTHVPDPIPEDGICVEWCAITAPDQVAKVRAFIEKVKGENHESIQSNRAASERSPGGYGTAAGHRGGERRGEGCDRGGDSAIHGDGKRPSEGQSAATCGGGALGAGPDTRGSNATSLTQADEQSSSVGSLGDERDVLVQVNLDSNVPGKLLWQFQSIDGGPNEALFPCLVVRGLSWRINIEKDFWWSWVFGDCVVTLHVDSRPTVLAFVKSGPPKGLRNSETLEHAKDARPMDEPEPPFAGMVPAPIRVFDPKGDEWTLDWVRQRYEAPMLVEFRRRNPAGFDQSRATLATEAPTDAWVSHDPGQQKVVAAFIAAGPGPSPAERINHLESERDTTLARAEKAKTWWRIGNSEVKLSAILELARANGLDPGSGSFLEWLDLTCRAKREAQARVRELEAKLQGTQEELDKFTGAFERELKRADQVTAELGKVAAQRDRAWDTNEILKEQMEAMASDARKLSDDFAGLLEDNAKEAVRTKVDTKPRPACIPDGVTEWTTLLSGLACWREGDQLCIEDRNDIDPWLYLVGDTYGSNGRHYETISPADFHAARRFMGWE